MNDQNAKPRRPLRTLIGAALMLLGFAALVTPLTPGSWLILVGAEMLGIRLVFWDRLRAWYQDRRAAPRPRGGPPSETHTGK